MKQPNAIFAIPGAALLAGLAAWGVVHGQPSSLPLPPPPPDQPVAPIFAGAPPPTAPPPVVLPRQDASLHEREDTLDAALDIALRDGTIDKTLGAQARLELDDIRYTEDRLRHRQGGQLTDAETFRLEGRLRALARIVRGGPGSRP